jgi:hypothetical protein
MILRANVFLLDMRIYQNFCLLWKESSIIRGKIQYIWAYITILKQSCRFLWISGNTVMSKQNGVYRVNCIDCLDRTNVVQVSYLHSLLLKDIK